jgi:hypothetical protein
MVEEKEEMEFYAVASKINSHKYNSPENIQRIT